MSLKSDLFRIVPFDVRESFVNHKDPPFPRCRNEDSVLLWQDRLQMGRDFVQSLLTEFALRVSTFLTLRNGFQNINLLVF